MIRFRLPVFALTAIVLVAACDSQDPVANDANASGVLPPPVNEAAPNPEAHPPPEANAPASNAELPAPASKIPVALQGRWALTPGDCTSTRGDAKGLLTITGDTLRFYESRAVPSGQIESDENSISGTFSFTGEGQSWSKFQSLQLKERGLVRTETNPTASYNYARCT
jgi:hypothetical protein